MRIEDIDREFRELARSLKEAQQAFRSGNFAQAEPLYQRALELTERSYGEDHADTCVCVQNLADTYYNLRKFKEAVPLFRRLLIMKEKQFGTSHAEVAAVLFKLAKTYEKLGMPNESESIYRRALRVGEQVYGRESTFVATILESFSAMLRRAQIRLPEAEQMEERVRDIRDKVGNPNRVTTNLLGNLAASIPPGGEEANQLVKDARSQTGENHFDTGKLRSLKSRGTTLHEQPTISYGPAINQSHVVMLVSLTLVALLFAGGAVLWSGFNAKNGKSETPGVSWSSFTSMLKGNDKGSSENVKRAFAFVSPDKLEQIVLTDSKHVLFTLRGVDLKGTYEADPTGITITPDQQSITYRYQKNSAGLVDAEGCTLYSSEAPELKIVKQMEITARATTAYFRKFNQYPSTIDQILRDQPIVAYKNPFNGETMLPVKKNILGYDENTADMNLNDFQNMQSTIRGLAVWRPDQFTPGAIEYYRASAGPEGDMAFIRGTDRNGVLIKSSKPGMAYIIICAGGHMRRD